jgi:hypothetical protein
MYLKCHTRFKDGKEHQYHSIAEKVSCACGRRVERHVFYLGEINDSPREAWLESIEVFDVAAQRQTKLALFASGQPVPAHAAVCAVQVSLRHQLRAKAPGLTVRQVLEKFSRMQMMDVHFPTTDGRELVFRRYTQPEAEQQLLLAQMKWELPPQSPPRITAKGERENGYRPLECPS